MAMQSYAPAYIFGEKVLERYEHQDTSNRLVYVNMTEDSTSRYAYRDPECTKKIPAQELFDMVKHGVLVADSLLNCLYIPMCVEGPNEQHTFCWVIYYDPDGHCSIFSEEYAPAAIPV